MAGLTPNGFEAKTFQTIKAEIDNDFRAAFGASIDTSGQSVFGQLIGIFSERVADLWQAVLAVFSAAYRDSASGIALDNLGQMIEVPRKGATVTQVYVTFQGVSGTAIPAGTLVKSQRGDEFETQDPSGVVGTPILAYAKNTGPVPATAGLITQILTPIQDVTSVSNAQSHIVLGRNLETDFAYRLRQQDSVTNLGKCTTGAIRRAVLDVANVTDCYVFENEQDSIDANGLPPHSFETVVANGLNTDIAQAIVDNKPVGIASYGSTSVTVPDANNFLRPILFSRPTNLDIWISWTLRVDFSKFPTNGETLIKAAISQFGQDNYRVGSEVRGSAFSQIIWPLNVGVKEFELPLIGLASNPVSSTSIQVSFRQKPVLDVARISLTILPAIGES